MGLRFTDHALMDGGNFYFRSMAEKAGEAVVEDSSLRAEVAPAAMGICLKYEGHSSADSSGAGCSPHSLHPLTLAL